MRVLMLGWEFPPFISGGLGTACYGLTRAMSRRGVEILFVLPRPVENPSSHVRLLGRETIASSPTPPTPSTPGERPSGPAPPSEAPADTYQISGFEHITFKAVPSLTTSPYAAPPADPPPAAPGEPPRGRPPHGPAQPPPEAAAGGSGERDFVHHGYSGDPPTDAHRYADRCVRLVGEEPFDVIHAHDWMTFPAGLALARRTGKPLIVHVHSTEYDRGGAHADPRIIEIERRGLREADAVVCVSHLTRGLCIRRHEAPVERIEVVHNGVENGDPHPRRATIRRGDKVVLFLGRITRQKGPGHFIEAARRVLEKVDNVRFVMAGAGDLAPSVMKLAAELGIEHRVLFTGFLRGEDVERVFALADVYVMPSVSEPFGIAPLEAVRHDVPVIISRNSGVAEVLHNALLVDSWDADDVAEKIIAVLRHPPLSRTLREHAELEVRRLTWDGAATRCMEIYHRLTAPPIPPAPDPRDTR